MKAFVNGEALGGDSVRLDSSRAHSPHGVANGYIFGLLQIRTARLSDGQVVLRRDGELEIRGRSKCEEGCLGVRLGRREERDAAGGN